MTESPIVAVEPVPPTRSRRKYTIIGLVFLVLIATVVVGYGYLYLAGSRELEIALSEVDELEPDGWHIPDIEARRPVLPDAENSALQVLAARKLMPTPWPVFMLPVVDDDAAYAARVRQSLDDSLGDIQPAVQLNEQQTTALRAELKRAEAALLEARKLLKMAKGRYQIAWSKDFIGTLLPHLQEWREVVRLLGYDAMLQAQVGHIDVALESCQAALNATRAIGDEPTLISQLVRIACRTIALKNIEGTLAQGQASAGALSALQAMLQAEADEPLLLYGLRGERAGSDGLMEAIQNGEIKMSQLRGVFFLGGGARTGFSQEDLQLLLLVTTVRSQRTGLLRYLTEMVEIAKLPMEQQLEKIKQTEAKVRQLPIVARMLAPATSKVSEACHRTGAEFRCAVAAIAVERYRLAHGYWPESLTELVPEYVKSVPKDPFDGAELRYLAFDEGVVIYSVGPDGVDNGGNITQNPNAPGSDLGFRLWDVKHRRQAPKPFPMPERTPNLDQGGDADQSPDR